MAIAAQAATVKAPEWASTYTTNSINSAASGSTFLIYGIGGYNSGTPATSGASGASDNKGNSYSLLATASTMYIWPKVWVCYNANGGAGHTATLTGGADNYLAGTIIEVSDCTAAPLDKYVDWTQDTSTPYLSGTTDTTTQADELILAFALGDVSSSATLTWGNSFSTLAEASLSAASLGLLGIGSRTVSSTGTYQSSFTSSVAPDFQFQTLIATFKQAGSATYAPMGATRPRILTPFATAKQRF